MFERTKELLAKPWFGISLGSGSAGVTIHDALTHGLALGSAVLGFIAAALGFIAGLYSLRIKRIELSRLESESVEEE